MAMYFLVSLWSCISFHAHQNRLSAIFYIIDKFIKIHLFFSMPFIILLKALHRHSTIFIWILPLKRHSKIFTMSIFYFHSFKFSSKNFCAEIGFIYVAE